MNGIRRLGADRSKAAVDAPRRRHNIVSGGRRQIGEVNFGGHLIRGDAGTRKSDRRRFSFEHAVARLRKRQRTRSPLGPGAVINQSA
jgi:hypothetical protein